MTKGKFIGMLFHAKNYIDLARFSLTGLGANNKFDVLEKISLDLYSSIEELIIGTQGEEGFIDIQIPLTIIDAQILVFLETLREFIRDNKKIFTQNWQITLLEKIEFLISSSIFKIKYL